MKPDTPHFDGTGRLIAPKYGDVYFSAEDGLAETRHVFLEGNRLAERFSAMQPGETFTVGETGFGTGLNFLAVWQCFEQHAPAGACLAFVSVEGLPLGCDTMARVLAPWPTLAAYRAALVAQWGPLWPGLHRSRFADGRVRLTLAVGEVEDALDGIEARCDAWFLDGFAPARNPEMWSETVFAQVARLSLPGATLATYTAAGFVRRGLASVGFEIQKRPGFGTKRDMTVGRLSGGVVHPDEGARAVAPSSATRSAIVIGGSIAGAFAARSLAERGMTVTVIERQAMIDSALPSLSPRAAVLQPKISDIDDPNGRWLREGYASAQRWLASDRVLAQRAGWSACGTFQAAVDDKAERRLRRFVEQFGEAGLCRWVDADQTEAELGIALPVGGAVVERAGLLRPAGLCAGLLDHANITVRAGMAADRLEREHDRWGVRLADGERMHADVAIVANALDAMCLEQTRMLELRPVRGQVTVLAAGGSAGQAGRLTGLKRALFYGGYALPAMDGVQSIGASFVPGDASLDWRAAEHADVCDKLARVLPDEADRLRSIDEPSGWVGVRTTTPTHRCYADQVEDGLYVSLGHGSHGIASAVAASEHLADLVLRSR